MYRIVVVWKSLLLLSEPLGETGAFAVVARIAKVEAVGADTADVLSDVEVHKVLVAGADDQADSLPQEDGQVDPGGEEDGQVADEEVRMRLRTVSDNARDKD